MSPSASKSPPRVIYWFRTDLRLHDSPALHAALSLSPKSFYPIWTWDPHYVYHARIGPNRWQFLLDCQADLSSALTKLNPKSKLFLLREAPQTLFPRLFKAWGITHLVFEKDTDAYGRERDEVVRKLAEEAGVEVITRPGRTLWDSDELVSKNGGKPTMSLSQVEAAGKKIGEIEKPLAAPNSIPDPGPTDIDFEGETPDPEPDMQAQAREHQERSFAKLKGPKGDFAVPTLEELGFDKGAAQTQHRGGETIALEMLDKIIKDEDYTATFEKPKTAPTAFDPQATTLLSPHLHFGSLSVREFYWRVRGVVDNYKGKASQPPTSLTGQLLFRDMYFGAQAALGHSFAQTVGNSHCRFIPWHLPSKIDPSTGRTTGDYHADDPQAESWFQRWKFGLTGFPWIDALMRQLRQEGWIHHLGRHSVACFLTRGGCYVDWERGADVFEEWLLDHETACNVGNWQWLSCTAFFAQFYRVYSPVAFPQKWDKDGLFVRKYVPELKDVDKKYIYEPWKAPIRDLKDAGVRLVKLGEDVDVKELEEGIEKGTYPKPMFDFSERRGICLEGMKQAYDVGLYGDNKKVVDGDNKKVVDGSWPSLFPDDGEGPTGGERFEFEDAEGDEEHHQDGHANGSVKKSSNGNGKGKGKVNGDDGAVEEEGEQAAEKGGESKGGDGDRKTAGSPKAKRKQAHGQGTLDGHVKKVKRE